jgi:hypothetical protein
MIEVTSNAGSLSVAYQAAPKLIAKNVYQTLNRIGLALVSYVKLEKLAGQILNYRTRTLSRALFSRVDLDAGSKDAVLTIGADGTKAPYARAQEYGAVIRPKNGQFLTIPVGVNLTGNGVQRVSAREFIANPGALGFETSFVNRRRTAIMGATRGQKPEPVFALKTEVTLAERSYLRSAVTDRREWIMGQLGIAVDESIRDLGETGV